MRTVGPNDQLRTLRKKRGLSRKQLAQQLGISHFTVGRWERGELLPSVLMLEQLCTLFACSAQELGFFIVSMPQPADPRNTSAVHVSLSLLGLDQSTDLAVSEPCIDPSIPWRVSPALVGRAELQAALHERLCRPQPNSVVALHGLPGMGKTTLAATLAHEETVRAYFSDGILWAGLGPRPNLLALFNRWGALLGIPASEMEKLTGIEAWSKALRTAIGARKMLIIIDDAWQLEEALACKIGGEQCRHLVTTRFPALAAQLAVEHVVQLQELNEEESIALLDVLASGVITADEQLGLELVRAVGGLPLALTLIGNYLRTQQDSGEEQRVQAALRRLNDMAVRLRISEPHIEADSPITRHPSLAPDTPLSLLSIIAVTDQLLDEKVRTVFYLLSLLPAKPDSFAEEMALALADCSSDELDQLMDAGLLECTVGDRYLLHQVIADYARLHLSEEEKGRAGMRLIHYVIEFIHTHQKEHELLDRESSTILTALELAHLLEERTELIQAVCAFAPFLIMRGFYGQADLHLQRAYDAAMALKDEGGCAYVLLYQGEMALKQSNFAQAEKHLQTSLELASLQGDQECVCDALTHLGSLTWRRGEYMHAEELLREGLAIARRLEDQEDREGREGRDSRERQERLLKILGSVLWNRGDVERGYATLSEGLELARQIGDREQMCVMLSNLGALLGEQGDHARAAELFREGLELARQIGHREQTCVLLINLGNLSKENGDYEQASAYFREGLALARQIRYPEWISVLLCSIASILLVQDEIEQAEHYLRESLAIARQVGRPHMLCNVLQEYAYYYLSQQRYQAAEESFREMLRYVPSGDQQWYGFAYYGLAQVAAMQSRYKDAQRFGTIGLRALERINHSRARSVREWLDGLPH
jgi:tetratricopeptide (TPR) repeat protein/transcriptional regulator with XRE-family HTH domain